VIFANKMPPKISKEKQPSQTKKKKKRSPHTTTKSSTGSSGAMQIISLTLFGAARFLSRRGPLSGSGSNCQRWVRSNQPLKQMTHF
jgi:hypothetical protein